MSESLYQLITVVDFLELLIWTGQLSDERPVSAIIVAPAGAGKTSVLWRVACDQAEFVGDITARTFHTFSKNQKLTHILLGDFLSLFGHRKSTVDLTMRLLSQATGESIIHDSWTGEKIEPKQLGLISAIPPNDLKKRMAHFEAGGFASRFILMKYDYKPTTIAAIHRFIAANRYASNHQKPFIMEGTGKLEVKINDTLAEEIKDFGIILKRDSLGFRFHRHLRALVKAQARRQKRTVATREDLLHVKTFCDFFSQEGKMI